jgi:hypothetical protein
MVEGLHIPPQHVNGPMVVAQAVIGLTQHERRHGLEVGVPEEGGIDDHK